MQKNMNRNTTVEVPDVAPEEVDVSSEPIFLSHEPTCESEQAVLLNYLTVTDPH
jgi:hypothetical protein